MANTLQSKNGYAVTPTARKLTKLVAAAFAPMWKKLNLLLKQEMLTKQKLPLKKRNQNLCAAWQKVFFTRRQHHEKFPVLQNALKRSLNFFRIREFRVAIEFPTIRINWRWNGAKKLQKKLNQIGFGFFYVRYLMDILLMFFLYKIWILLEIFDLLYLVGISKVKT